MGSVLANSNGFPCCWEDLSWKVSCIDKHYSVGHIIGATAFSLFLIRGSGYNTRAQYIAVFILECEYLVNRTDNVIPTAERIIYEYCYLICLVAVCISIVSLQARQYLHGLLTPLGSSRMERGQSTNPHLVHLAFAHVDLHILFCWSVPTDVSFNPQKSGQPK